MKKGKLDIPTDWPRPWKELGFGQWRLLGYRVLIWKKYKRPASFKIYGFSKGPYLRIWYGKNVLHMQTPFKKTNKKWNVT